MTYSDEDVVDFSIGTIEEQRAAAERIEARRREVEEAWRALPLWYRIYVRARLRLRGKVQVRRVIGRW